MKNIDLKGQIFSRLIVIKRGPNTKNRAATWICKCSCGTITKPIESKSLRKQKTQSCGCLLKEKSKISKRRLINPKISSIYSLYKQYQNSAKHKKHLFQLTIEQFSKIIFQNCYYCNQEPSKIFSNYFKKDGSPSYRSIKKNLNLNDVYFQNSIIKVNGIDRLNNNIGYSISNTVPCCWVCNNKKSNSNYNDFLSWIEKIYHNRVKNKNA